MRDEIRFRPWRGDRYGKGLFGVPILVVGESHYKWKGRPVDEGETTRVVVRGWMNGDRKRFSTGTVIAFTGKTPSEEQVKQFWDSVAFYNYVQHWVGNGSRIRPQPSMWDNEDPFRVVLRKLRPKLVVALGLESWRNLPKFDRDRRTLRAGGKESESGYFTTAGEAETLAIGIMHPSSSHFSGKQWTPLVKRAVTEARAI